MVWTVELYQVWISSPALENESTVLEGSWDLVAAHNWAHTPT